MTNKTPIPIDKLRLLSSDWHVFSIENGGHRAWMVVMDAAKEYAKLREDLESGRVAIVPVEPTAGMMEVALECFDPAYPNLHYVTKKTIAAAPAYEFGGGE